ncbi:MAG: alanine dehydrogenase [Gammaproteobacteria bacterium]|nr:alanine dehydrogenase [Gammaproteobacteria bacterium]
MKIGVIKEIKNKENRVGLTPDGARRLAQLGHEIRIDQGAGLESGFSDEEYVQAGARPVSTEQAWDSDLVVKVKEPLAVEYPFLRDQIVFTYFHLAGVTPTLTETLLERHTTAIAYETVEDAAGRLPLLAPMSAVAGNMAVTMGGYYLGKPHGGKGMLLGDVLGHSYGKVVVIGDGVVGRHAARAAAGMGAQVLIFGRHPERESGLKQEISPSIRYLLSEREGIAQQLRDADLVVGGVLIRGAKAPRLVTEAMVKTMQPGSVIVDVSIDQGGCVETSHPTSHSDPVFRVHGVTHYCVANMPGAYPRTSTLALTTATFPYVQSLAEQGIGAVRPDPGLARGVNTFGGHITCEAVAADLGLLSRYRGIESIL